MIDFRCYINPQPRGKATAAWQSEGLPDGIPYVENKTGEVIDALIRSVRPGSIVVVRRLFCLAPWTGTPRKRRVAMAARLDAIKERGGAVLESETQRRSDVAGHCAQMLMGGYEDIATSGRAVSRGRTGRPAREYSKEQDEAMARIWFSRRYKTRKDATEAIRSLGINVTTPALYQRFGVPDKQATDASEVVPVKPKKVRQRRVANFIYFARSGNAVKIGLSNAPSNRVKNMAVGNHSDIKLLATMPGTMAKERALHRKFKKHRIKGEWFQLVPAITKYIAGVKGRLNRSNRGPRFIRKTKPK